MKNYFCHKTAQVDRSAKIGKNTKIWNYSQIREYVRIGENCIIAKGVYIDKNVNIGDRVKIQNNVSIFNGVKIENNVFIGPHVCFTNDKNPRSVNEMGEIKEGGDWEVSSTKVGEGASIGANSTILPNVIIGKYAMIGAGSVVVGGIPDYSLVYGNPARIHGKVNKEGVVIEKYNSE